MPSPSLPSSPCPRPSPGLSRSWVDKTLPVGLRGLGGKGEAGAWAEERLRPEPLRATSAAFLRQPPRPATRERPGKKKDE